ncbi:MAG: hypothetical protein IKI63_02020 [Clostridia bacterium]|nr:hypothetical protein [Clostridia bacterium]
MHRAWRHIDFSSETSYTVAKGKMAQTLVVKGESIMYCKICGTHYAGGSSVCPSCGFPINEVENWNIQPSQSFTPSPSQRASFCKYCGAHYEEGALRCPSCDSPTDEGEGLLKRFDESNDSRTRGKKRFSGFTLAADILSLVTLAFAAIFRLKAQSTIYAVEATVPNINPAISSYFLQVKLIVSVIIVVMMIISLCLAEATKRTTPRERTDTVLVSLFAGVASLGLIFLLK